MKKTNVLFHWTSGAVRSAVIACVAMLAFVFVGQSELSAQSFTTQGNAIIQRNDVYQNADFISSRQAETVLKQEIGILQDAAQNYNGGSAEFLNSVQTSYLLEIFNMVSEGTEVGPAIATAYESLLDHADNATVSVDVEDILESTVEMLSN